MATVLGIVAYRLILTTTLSGAIGLSFARTFGTVTASAINYIAILVFSIFYKWISKLLNNLGMT